MWVSMKIRIELDENVKEEEIIIRCSGLSEEVLQVQKTLSDITIGKQKLCFYKGDTEYYLAMDEFLFFETEGSEINAHTVNDVYQTKYKLYELEELLPGSFMRVSKSAILNTNKIFSMTKNISSCLIQFQHTYKQVYVSRNYFKPLKDRLEAQRKK